MEKRGRERYKGQEPFGVKGGWSQERGEGGGGSYLLLSGDLQSARITMKRGKELPPSTATEEEGILLFLKKRVLEFCRLVGEKSRAE